MDIWRHMKGLNMKGCPFPTTDATLPAEFFHCVKLAKLGKAFTSVQGCFKDRVYKCAIAGSVTTGGSEASDHNIWPTHLAQVRSCMSWLKATDTASSQHMPAWPGRKISNYFIMQEARFQAIETETRMFKNLNSNLKANTRLIKHLIIHQYK